MHQLILPLQAVRFSCHGKNPTRYEGSRVKAIFVGHLKTHCFQFLE